MPLIYAAATSSSSPFPRPSTLTVSPITLGYSPERINPGDREHTIERIVKVVSGQDAATLDRVAAAYAAIARIARPTWPSTACSHSRKGVPKHFFRRTWSPS
jgi:UDP-N-acetyl-D-mannosaminuronate dehydrogenase